MVSDAGPITWQFIRKTFTTTERTRELLAPELEQSLSLADFEKAVNFLPGSQRYWPNVLGIASSVVVCSYGNFRPKPWSFARSTVIGGLAGFGGATLGLFMNLRAHKKFIDSLEDQRGFKRALTNVSARLDGISPIPQQQDTYGQGDTSHQYVSSSINSVLGNVSGSTDVVPHGRWDAIRAANARNPGRTSSWDALRQSHERNHIAASDEAPIESERAREQARFDAMLEAERRKSQT